MNHSYQNLVYARDAKNNHGKLKCFYCDTPLEGTTLPFATVDHIWPDSRDGASRPCNLITACHSCNAKRGVTVPKISPAKMTTLFGGDKQSGFFIQKSKRNAFLRALRGKIRKISSNAATAREKSITTILQGGLLSTQPYKPLLDE